MAAKTKVSIEPNFKKSPVAVSKPVQSAKNSVPAKKKVVKKVIRKVVKKPATTANPEELKRKQAILKATATADARDHDIKSDYLDRDVPLERSNLRLYIASIVVMVIFILITVGLVYAKGRVETNKKVAVDSEEKQEIVEEQTLTVTEIKEPVEEEIVVLEPKDITLEILNGSGVAGAASGVQEEFEDLGYIVDSIGNSEEVEKSELYVSSEYSDEELATLLEDVDRRLGIKDITGSLRDLDTVARIILGVE